MNMAINRSSFAMWCAHTKNSHTCKNYCKLAELMQAENICMKLQIHMSVYAFVRMTRRSRKVFSHRIHFEASKWTELFFSRWNIVPVRDACVCVHVYCILREHKSKSRWLTVSGKIELRQRKFFYSFHRVHVLFESNFSSFFFLVFFCFLLCFQMRWDCMEKPKPFCV